MTSIYVLSSLPYAPGICLGGHSCYPNGQDLRSIAESREGFVGRYPPPHQLEDLGSAVSEARLQIHFGRTKSPENAYSGRKCRLHPAHRFRYSWILGGGLL